MHVIAPARYQQQPQRRSSKRPFAVALLAVAFAAAGINFFRPLPTPVATLTVSIPAAASNPVMPWPSEGQAAIAADGYGLLGTSGTLTPLATASIAKVITALCVLQKAPLNIGQAGPTYTVTADDVAIYQNYIDQNGSLILVVQGEQLTEYQALEALMLPSANNIADSLVRWVFGSQQAYTAYATSWLEQNDLNDTRIGPDASGYDAGTMSTASNLASLGLLAIQDPVLMEIAGKSSTTLPVAGRVTNYDTILGVNGITGLKTGNNDADPGAFLFTANAQIGDKTIPLTGSVMGAADLDTALQNSTQLVAAMQQGFEELTVAHANQQVGTLKSVWGTSTPITSAKTLELVRWKAVPLTATHSLDPKIRSGTIGNLKLAAGNSRAESKLQLAHPLPGPGFWWRLTRH